MSSMGTSLIAFLVIATLVGLVFLLALRALSGKEIKVNRRSFILTLLVPLLVGTAIFGFLSFMEFHEQPVLCGDYCHSMGPVYESYLEPANNTIMDVHGDENVTCLNCHTGPGVWGQIEIYFVVPHEVWSEVTGSYDLEDLGGDVRPDQCLKCHDGEFATYPGNVTTAIGTETNPHEILGDCIDCHSPHDPGIGLPEQTCQICHGTTIQYFDEKLEAHGERVGEDCLECHDRLHPEDAQIPWSSVPDLIDMDFCSDCHPEVVDVYLGSASDLSLELYGTCTDCHSEHTESVPPHLATDEFDDCEACHLSFTPVTLMHNRLGVSYLNFTGLDNEFCWPCHTGYESAMPSIHRSLECVECHTDHYLRVEFEGCMECHDEIPSWHVNTTGGCVDPDCHGTWFYHG